LKSSQINSCNATREDLTFASLPSYIDRGQLSQEQPSLVSDKFHRWHGEFYTRMLRTRVRRIT
jgi:hypothetical protein